MALPLGLLGWVGGGLALTKRKAELGRFINSFIVGLLVSGKSVSCLCCSYVLPTDWAPLFISVLSSWLTCLVCAMHLCGIPPINHQSWLWCSLSGKALASIQLDQICYEGSRVLKCPFLVLN